LQSISRKNKGVGVAHLLPLRYYAKAENTMATNLEIKKNANESSVNLIRRFSKGVRESGVLNRVRGTRFFERTPSKLTKKTQALKRIEKTAEIEKLKKLGKM